MSFWPSWMRSGLVMLLYEAMSQIPDLKNLAMLDKVSSFTTK